MKYIGRNIYRFFFLILIMIYIFFIPITSSLSNIDAIMVLLFSVIVLIKARKNLGLFIMFVFIAYVNYSVVMGEYIFFESLSVPMQEVKTELVYGITIRILLMFISIIALLYNGKCVDVLNIRLSLKNNWIIFSAIIVVLICVLFLGIDRGALDSYSVRISPIFEYSKILFLFAYYYSGDKKNRKIVLFIVMSIFILSDFYYGGRITSLQILILMFITIFAKKITFKKVISFSGIGIVLNALIGAYRESYSIHTINVLNILNDMINNLFVFDTATFAYYASATHVAAFNVADTYTKINSFWNFLKAVVLGTSNNSSDVTILVRANYFHNYGGGFMPTHFYFWFGWIGVIVIAIIIVLIVNSWDPTKGDFNKILYLAFIINSPRWYLYTPNQLFRGVMIIVPILFIILKIIHMITTRPNIRT